MNILAFAGSNSKKSINKQLALYAASQLENSTAKIIDINDFAMPIYGEDLEHAHGIPDAANHFLKEITNADALIVSLAEHNGNYTVAFKNLLDWCSRVDRNIFQDKAILLLATSPGPGGASKVLKIASDAFPFFGGNIVASFSLPSFHKNFDVHDNTITQDELKIELQEKLRKLVGAVVN